MGCETSEVDVVLMVMSAVLDAAASGGNLTAAASFLQIAVKWPAFLQCVQYPRQREVRQSETGCLQS